MNQAAKNMWNSRFNVQEFIFGEKPNQYLSKVALEYLRPNQKVLCVADGEGRNSVWLAKQGLEVEAFDFSDIAINKAKEFAVKSQAEVDFSQSSWEDWDWTENTYDAIAAIFIQFASPAEREILFANMLKSLKPGGVLILQGYTPKQLDYKTGGPSDVDYLYTEPLLRQLFQGMELLEITSYEAVMSEGPGHNGMSALVGVVAQKPIY